MAFSKDGAAGSSASGPTIYSADGTISGSRLVTAIDSNILAIKAFDSGSEATATLEGSLRIEDSQTLIKHSTLDGAGSVTGMHVFELSSTGIVITDTIDTKGVVYAADYSANFTDRSLVDKGYVDGKVSGASNLYNSNGVISGNRDVEGFNGIVYDTRVYNNASVVLATTGSKKTLDGGGINFGFVNYSGGSMVSETAIVFNSSGAILFDTANSAGMRYSGNYSANFVDRTLVDKGYTDLGHLARVESGAANLTSSGKPILAVTDSTAPRIVTIATGDVVAGNQFIVKDEDGDAGINMITVTTPTISVTSVAAGTSGSDFLTSTSHDYSINQRIIHAGFADNSYNGLFTVTDIVSATRYEVAAITFAATDAGTSNVAMDGQSSFTISVDYGSLELYCSDNQVFTNGSSTPSALANRNSSTGLLNGGDMSIVDLTHLDIGSVRGQIVNQDDPINPTITSVSYPGDSNYLIANSTDGVFVIAIDINGDISEIDLTDVTTENRHDFILIGAYVYSSVAVGAVRILNEPINIGYGGTVCASDFIADVIGPVNMDGNVITANGVNLSIDNSGGTTFIIGQNFRQDPDKPHQRTIPQVSQIPFRRSYRSATGELLLDAGGATFTVIDPSRFDDGSGTLATVSANDFTVQVVYIAPSGIYNVAFGQTVYNSLAIAEAAVRDGTLGFTEIDAFLEQVKAAYIIVRNNATDLTDPAQALFIQTTKFRDMVRE